MSNFKYSLNCMGSEESCRRFSLDLDSVGYTNLYKTHTHISCRGIVVNNSSTNSHFSACENGAYIFWYTTVTPYDRDFTFNIDNKWEYEAALAIAAIRDNECPHVGEWVKFLEGDWSGPDDNHDILYQVEKAYGGGSNVYSTKGYSGDGWQTNLNGRYSRKATPEEIIEHFKKLYMKQLPEKWCIEGPISNYSDLMEHIRSKYDDITITGTSNWFYHFGSHSWETYRIVKTDYKKVTYEQWKELYYGQTRKVVGYKLIKEYPGSVKLGTKLTNIKETAEKYPEFWQPIYEEEKEKEVILTLGDTQVQVTITKNKIIVDKVNWRNSYIQAIISRCNQYHTVNGYEVWIKPNNIDRCIKIGCCKFSILELEKILETQKKLANT